MADVDRSLLTPLQEGLIFGLTTHGTADAANGAPSARPEATNTNTPP